MPCIAGWISATLADHLGALRLDSWRYDWFRKALGHYRRAAERHDPQALTNLGDFAFLGIGGEPRDEAEAFRRYKRGADAGDWHAYVNLGVMLCKGWGCEADLARGWELLRKAQAAGLAMAEIMLWFCTVGHDDEIKVPYPDVSRFAQAYNEFYYPAANRGLDQFFKGVARFIVYVLALIAVVFAVLRYLVF